MKTRRLVIFILVLCSISTLAFSQSVNVDWKHGTNFSTFKTYAWGQSPHPINDSLWHQRIMDIVDKALAGKGLKKVEIGAKPDLVIVYSAGIKQNVSYQGYSMGWYNRTGSISEVIEREGTLVIDIANPLKQEVVWRGIASDTLSDKSSKNTTKVQKMVSKMFQKYPPAV